ncbi:unnamed protein product [Clonostachys rhizophaga]|uniref:Uncharacterized protein n=1 Tax=Clonostachys rhizophaga TaxID=160324 RepID=A0A9N9VFU5_9HYPO|nr:unnamed protein product [Clonostachys rhizophaga]
MSPRLTSHSSSSSFSSSSSSLSSSSSYYSPPSPSSSSSSSYKPRKASQKPDGSRKPHGFSSWEEGDIAFLKPWNEIENDLPPKAFSSFHKAIGHQKRACNHPVIILKASPDGSHFAVTTVSAYSSSSDNDYLAPWNQPHHFRKAKKDFRSFDGSERANGRPTLLLEGNKLMPKPELSWVYIQSILVVDKKALKVFTKSRDHLRLTPRSLTDLWAHMEAETRDFDRVARTLATAIMAPQSIAQPHRKGQEQATGRSSNLPAKAVPTPTSPPVRPSNPPSSWAQVVASKAMTGGSRADASSSSAPSLSGAQSLCRSESKRSKPLGSQNAFRVLSCA